MKHSRRNIRNATLRAERRSEGPPAVSRYARKVGKEPDVHTAPDAYAKTRGIDTREPE